MPSYKERAELIKALSEDQYFKARLNKDESESVRIGDRDGRTGRYQVLRQDGGVTNNGIKTFNQAAPQDGFVRVLGNSSGGIALDHRNRKREERKKTNQEEPTLVTPIKFLQSKVSTDYSEIYIGGDRKDPELIFTVPNGYSVGATITGFVYPTLSTLGSGTDEWIVQVVSSKTEILEAASTGGIGIKKLYQTKPDIFQKYQILSTITSSGRVDLYSDGVVLSDGSVFTNQNSVLARIVFSEYQSSVLTQIASLTIADIYDTTANTSGLWTYLKTDRAVTRTDLATALDPSAFDAVINSARAILLANGLNVIDWRTASDTGISSPSFSGYLTTFVLPIEDLILGELIAGKFVNFTPKNGWWFGATGIYTKSPTTWFEGYSSFGSSNAVTFNKTTFNSLTQTNTIAIQKDDSNLINIPVTPKSFKDVYSPNLNIDIRPPIPSFDYKPLLFIQGWNKQTQLIKINNDWRLYLSDGSYTVVQIPTYSGVSFLQDIEVEFIRTKIDLIEDCLFVILNSNILPDSNSTASTVLIVGAQLTTTPVDVTTAKVLTCYSPSIDLGQTDAASLYLTIDDYNALSDYAP